MIQSACWSGELVAMHLTENEISILKSSRPSYLEFFQFSNDTKIVPLKIYRKNYGLTLNIDLVEDKSKMADGLQ